jgi:putative Mn2+ efflux pump MntP
MNLNSTSAIFAAAISLATLHALIPSHWLAFVLVARSQHWTLSRTMVVTSLAGVGHIAVTTVLGVGIAALGKEASEVIPHEIEHVVASVLLILLGGWYILPPMWGRVHRHSHDDHSHSEETGHEVLRPPGLPKQTRLSSAPIGALILSMTLSPCLDFLPIYVAASTLSWLLIALISFLLATITVGLMLVLVWCGFHGLSKLKLAWLDRYEPVAVGGVLILLGAMLFFL